MNNYDSMCEQTDDVMAELAVIVASAGLDYDHPGVTNSYLQATHDTKAIVHNNRSVLERHHASSVFLVLHSIKFRPLVSFFEGISR